MVIAFKRKNFVLLMTASVLMSMIAGGYLDHWLYSYYLENRSLAMYCAGMEYYHKRKPDEAAALFNMSLGLRDSYESTLYLGMIHADQGRYRLALEYFQASLQLLEARRSLWDLPSIGVKHKRRRILNEISVLKSKQKLTE